jgi:hypothetical protein
MLHWYPETVEHCNFVTSIMKFGVTMVEKSSHHIFFTERFPTLYFHEIKFINQTLLQGLNHTLARLPKSQNK